MSPKCKQAQRKNDILGMSYGKANGILRKSIMFDMAKALARDVCYRCGENIFKIEDFSIEHKTGWQSSENPKEYFFDLHNIAFSHYLCNVKAASKPTKLNSDEARRISDLNSQIKTQKNRLASRKAWRQRRRESGLSYT